MTVLTVNAGSSSICLATMQIVGGVPKQRANYHGGQEPAEAEGVLQRFLAGLAVDTVRAVARRSRVLRHSAPLHNPVALAWLRACRAVLGEQVPQVAVFDTAFYAELPHVARSYALPRALCERLSIRRYGFHGLAHGCNVAQLARAATRHRHQHTRHFVATRRRLLNHESGLLDVSGASADMRALLASEDSAVRLAVELYCYRARKYVGAYLAALGGADAILFGGGVGENAPVVREKILGGMQWAHLSLHAEANRNALGIKACISRIGDDVANDGGEIWVIPVDEAAILAEEAQAVLSGKA